MIIKKVKLGNPIPGLIILIKSAYETIIWQQLGEQASDNVENDRKKKKSMKVTQVRLKLNHTKTCTVMFIGALLTIEKLGNNQVVLQ